MVAHGGCSVVRGVRSVLKCLRVGESPRRWWLAMVDGGGNVGVGGGGGCSVVEDGWSVLKCIRVVESDDGRYWLVVVDGGRTVGVGGGVGV